MLKLIHFSDFHNQSRAITNAVTIAKQHHDWDVVAMTGDCTTKDHPDADERLNSLPQSHLFCVPGNHFGKGETRNEYRHLTRWKTNWPYYYDVKGSWFIGLDTNNIAGSSSVIDKLAARWDIPPLFVIMMHYSPNNSFIEIMLNKIFCARKKRKPTVLILHGDTHPKNPPYVWENREIGSDWNVWISNVCSCDNQCRGGANFIEWDRQILRHEFKWLT